MPLADLLSRTPAKSLAEMNEFSRCVYGIVTDPEGKFFAVEGQGGRDDSRHLIKVYDSSGNEILNVPAEWKGAVYGLMFDPTGKLLAVHVREGGHAVIRELPSGKVLGTLHYCPSCLDPQKHYWIKAVSRENEPQGLWLFRSGDEAPVLGLSVGMVSTLAQPQLDSTGTLLAWVPADGTVSIADIPEIRRQLANLAWIGNRRGSVFVPILGNLPFWL